MPEFIRKIAMTTGAVGLFGAMIWSYWNWRAGVTLACSVSWAVANIYVWTRLIQNVIVAGPRKPLAVLWWIAAKLALLGSGMTALWLAAPLTAHQTLALLMGVSGVLITATVFALAGTGTVTAGQSTKSLSTLVGAALVVLLFLAASHGKANVPAPGVSPRDQAPAAAAPTASAPVHEANHHETGETKESAGAHATAATEEHGAEGAHHGEEAAKPELPNLITVILKMEVGGKRIADTALGHFLHTYEYQIFLVLITAFLCGLVFATAGLRALIPGPTQALLEIIVEGFLNFFTGVLGSREAARRHMPFFGSIFLFIWFNNMFGIVPLFTGATSTFQLTASLAVLVFFYVHFNAIREAGFKHWLMHLLQDPKDVLGWVLAPLFFVLHVIGELAKPLSLSLRLFGNITGEHILSGVFLILGMLLMSAIWPQPWVGVPLHLPFLFLSLLVGTIQATVFTLLSSIYLALFLPHEEHGHEGGHVEASAHH